MPRQVRNQSASGFYHVIQRGIGKQVIFEDSYDYIYFLKLLSDLKIDESFELHAYCLMDNHFHLLVRTRQPLSDLMQKISSKYASYYNKKYGRIGHLFQDRFKSEPIDDREYYFTVIRYILNNPVNANISNLENYRWSSYWDYLRGSKLTDTSFLYKMIGGQQNFKNFMLFDINSSQNTKCIDVDYSYHINDTLAQSIIKNVLGLTSGTELQNMEKPARNAACRTLYRNGLSIRQIERLTGVSRGVVYKALNATTL